jgi:hypothetical protein
MYIYITVYIVLSWTAYLHERIITSVICCGSDENIRPKGTRQTRLAELPPVWQIPEGQIFLTANIFMSDIFSGKCISFHLYLFSNNFIHMKFTAWVKLSESPVWYARKQNPCQDSNTQLTKWSKITLITFPRRYLALVLFES